MQKHCSIVGNPFAQNGKLSAANSHLRIAYKVKPSEFRNHPGDHFARIATIQANIPRIFPTL
jgi:hypothetical protein